jgi:hypothetical protein
VVSTGRERVGISGWDAEGTVVVVPLCLATNSQRTKIVLKQNFALQELVACHSSWKNLEQRGNDLLNLMESGFALITLIKLQPIVKAKFRHRVTMVLMTNEL